VAAVLFLLARRFTDPQVKYISLAADYFPLFLILSIAGTGMVMRYLVKTDIERVKLMVTGIMTLRPQPGEGVGSLFYVHVLLVSSLLAYFPLSKLMHLGGVFMSPTRNLANTSRVRRHINPWNPDIKIHTYAEYEADFWKVMQSVDLPLDKTYEEEKK
jgi:nitrate reductase gamma subunit